MGVVLICALPIRGESHIQHNANGEVATTFPPLYNEPQQSLVLFVKAALGMAFTSWPQHQHIAVMGKTKRQVRKASHCGSKQHSRDHSIIPCLCHIK